MMAFRRQFRQGAVFSELLQGGLCSLIIRIVSSAKPQANQTVNARESFSASAIKSDFLILFERRVFMKKLLLLMSVSVVLAGMAGATTWVRPTVNGPGNWNDPANWMSG